MNAAHVTTIGEIRNLININNIGLLLETIADGFGKVYYHHPSSEEKNAWKNSIPMLITSIPKDCDPLPIIFELRMPIGNERADAVILGGKNRAIIVELKHWSGKIQKYETVENQIVLGGSNGVLRTHPGYQCDGYVGKIKNQELKKKLKKQCMKQWKQKKVLM